MWKGFSDCKMCSTNSKEMKQKKIHIKFFVNCNWIACSQSNAQSSRIVWRFKNQWENKNNQHNNFHDCVENRRKLFKAQLDKVSINLWCEWIERVSMIRKKIT